MNFNSTWDIYGTNLYNNVATKGPFEYGFVLYNVKAEIATVELMNRTMYLIPLSLKLLSICKMSTPTIGTNWMHFLHNL